MMPTKEPAVDAQIAEARRVCAAQGARLTELRELVLTMVLRARAPLTAYRILDQLKACRGSAVPPTVYRALDFLMAHGLVHKIERLGAFVGCHGASGHAHPVQFLICRRCGTVAEIEDHAVSEALEAAARKAGFHAGAATIEIDGTCSFCG